ncbi:MAG: NAD-dependent protein deacylase, partial [Deltaproteobacteria bacterium]|nr:NAD-dependent protein deacylase [Deltaproteobacteria bacterium]
RAAAELMARAHRTVALTGAGVSVASGVPDFRGESGLWRRFDPRVYATIDAFVSDPDRVWQMFRAVGQLVVEAAPNPAHFALAALERMGLLRAIVTQNIDGLHQLAGSKRVLEYHGGIGRLHCLGCGAIYPAKRAAGVPDRAPRCGCGNALKPTVVMYGEQLPGAVVEEAAALALEADLVLSIGTSAAVAPASELPLLAKRAGARVIEFNLSATELTPRVTDLLVEGPAEQTLPATVAAISGR